MAFTLSIRNPFIVNRTTEGALTNMFNEAFFAFTGGGITKYDYEAQTYVQKGYNENADVYAIVSQISRKFASVPALFNTGDTETVNPLPKPNYYQSEAEYKELWETFMLLTGNAYQWILKPSDGPNKGKPLMRFLLPSHLVKIVLKEDAALTSTENPIDYYALVIGNVWIEFKADDVIHSKFPNPNYDSQGSHLYGRSPLAASLRDIQVQNVTRDTNLKTMNSGGTYGFIHAKDGQTPLTPDQANDLKDRLIQMQADEGFLGRIGGASAPLGFTKLSVDTADLQPFAFLKNAQKSICNVLGWSDKLLNNDDGAKYDNLDYAWKMSISNRIAPDLRIYEEGLNSHFYPLFDPKLRVKFDVSELPEMQADMKTLTDWLLSCLKEGVLNRDEVRVALKYSETKMAEMLQYTVQSGTIPIEDIAVNDEEIARGFNLE